MNRQQFFNNLQLDNHNIFNKQIKPITRVQSDFVVNHRQRNLPLCFDTGFAQFIGQTDLIRAFKKTRPQGCMDLDRIPRLFRRSHFQSCPSSASSASSAVKALALELLGEGDELVEFGSGGPGCEHFERLPYTSLVAVCQTGNVNRGTRIQRQDVAGRAALVGERR